MTLDSINSVSRVIKAVHNLDERKLWDKDIESTEILSIEGKKVLIWY